jgi:hypothetical protein
VANAVLLMVNIGVHLLVLVLVLVGLAYVGLADQSMQRPRDSHCIETCKSVSFWTYMAICSLLIPVRTLFRHLDLTVPAYLTHVLGPDVEFPYIQAINPTITVVGVGILALIRFYAPENPVICRGSKYWTIVSGTLLCAVGFLTMGLLLLTRGNPMLIVGVGIGIFSVGEVYWSSIFSSYALGQAPEGQEASYSALVAIPSLAVKLPSSLLSSALIRTYCPANGQYCDGVRMWVIIGSIALITPVALIVGSRWLNRKKAKALFIRI